MNIIYVCILYRYGVTEPNEMKWNETIICYLGIRWLQQKQTGRWLASIDCVGGFFCGPVTAHCTPVSWPRRDQRQTAVSSQSSELCLRLWSDHRQPCPPDAWSALNFSLNSHIYIPYIAYSYILMLFDYFSTHTQSILFFFSMASLIFRYWCFKYCFLIN